MQFIDLIIATLHVCSPAYLRFLWYLIVLIVKLEKGWGVIVKVFEIDLSFILLGLTLRAFRGVIIRFIAFKKRLSPSLSETASVMYI